MNDSRQISILIVDDDPVYRRITHSILATIPHVTVTGEAADGDQGIAMIRLLNPDLVILDLHMPVMNGLDVLTVLQKENLNSGVIVLSAFSTESSLLTMKALELGAFDFIPKPSGDDMKQNRTFLISELSQRISAFAHKKIQLNSLSSRTRIANTSSSDQKSRYSRRSDDRTLTSAELRKTSRIVGIGVSTGGPDALMQMLPRLPRDLNVPIVVVQHMPPMFTKAFAQKLDSKCALHVKEGENGETILRNTIYIAPGGKQMKIAKRAIDESKFIRITDDPPENNCKPSIDYLFRSIAYNYGRKAIGVIMTGMGSDGTLGLKLMKRQGARIIAQDEKSCVVFGLPRTPIESGIVNVVCTLTDMAGEIESTIRTPSI